MHKNLGGSLLFCTAKNFAGSVQIGIKSWKVTARNLAPQFMAWQKDIDGRCKLYWKHIDPVNLAPLVAA